MKEEAEVKAWRKKVGAANKAYNKWNQKFECDRLEGYYAGTDHWPEDQKGNYTINMCFAGIEIRLPSMLFYRPEFKIRPKNAKLDDPATNISDRAQLREDMVNTVTKEAEAGFEVETKLALREAQYRFGIIYVGYDADTVENPNVGKPVLKEDGTEERDSKGEVVIDTRPKIIEAESIYFERIPASNFRVSSTAHNQLRRCEWVGFYKWAHLEDIKANPYYDSKATKDVKASGTMSKAYTDDESDEVNDKKDADEHKGMVRVWTTFDLRQKVKRVFADNGKRFFRVEPFKTLPLSGLKFFDLMDEWYPVPPTYNWLSPQNELNETRNMQRIHRRRFYRRYLVENNVDENEMKKLETGGDGTWARVQDTSKSIRPLEDAPLDRAVAANVSTAREDLMYVSGVSGEQQAVSASTTATQAQIIDTNVHIRETQGRFQVAKWLSNIAKIAIEIMEEKMGLPFWIERNVDMLGPGAQAESARVAAVWEQITASKLGKLDYEVDVDVEALSPVTEDIQRQQWDKIMAILTNPPSIIALMGSDKLLKKTLGFYGIKGDSDIAEIRQAMQAVLMSMSGAPGPGGPGGPGGPAGIPSPGPGGTMGPGVPPGLAGIMDQVKSQTGRPGGVPQ